MAKRKGKKRAARGQWSARDINLLRKLFPTNPTSRIARKLGRKTDAVKKKASRMGLKKDKRYMRRIGRG